MSRAPARRATPLVKRKVGSAQVRMRRTGELIEIFKAWKAQGARRTLRRLPRERVWSCCEAWRSARLHYREDYIRRRRESAAGVSSLATCAVHKNLMLSQRR